MEYRSLLPVVVLCTVFGFPLVSCYKPKLQKLYNVYCWLVNFLICVVWIFHIFVLRHLIDYTYLSVVASISGLLYVVVFFYYRIIFIFFGDENFMECLLYVDKKLESLNINIPHGRNQITSLVTIFLSIFTYSINYYRNFEYLFLPIVNDKMTISEPILFGVFVAVVNAYSTVFVIRLFILLYFLWQRLRLIRTSLLNYNRRNIGWSDRGFVPVLRTLSSRIHFGEDINYIKTLTSLYCYSFDIFESSRTFYSCFVNFYVPALLVWYPVQLVFKVIICDGMIFRLATFGSLFFQQMPLIAWIFISYELKKVHYLIHGLHHKLQSENLQKDIKTWLHKCGNYNTEFYCGFFTVDTEIFSIFSDYIVLIVFAMLPSVY